MSQDYVISCCSTADLPKEYFEKRDIKYVCFSYYLDDVCYPDDLGQTMSFPDFYEALINGAEPRTSQVNTEDYITHFKKFLDEGKDVIHLTLSSGISGTINSAQVAKSALEDEYPDRKICIIDSLAASAGFGLLMDKLADLRDEGKSFEEVVAFTEENKLNLHHWFFSSDLTFFIKGGRVSKTAGFVGGLLNICPMLNVNSEGKLIPRDKIRTKKKAIVDIVNRMEKYADDGLDYSGKCFISNAYCEDDAKAVAALIEERFPKLDGKVMISSIGTTIGAHTGPGTVALFFWGNKREL